MIRLLLTGADGFTGRYLLDQAKNLGYEVHPLQSDLLNQDTLIAEILRIKPTHVVHLAAITAVTHSDEKEFYQVNLFGTLNLLNALTELPYRLGNVLLASSANIYGNIEAQNIGEEELPNPQNHYAMSKLAMEFMARSYLDRLPLFFVRPFNYTGRGQGINFVIPKIAEHFKNKTKEIELGRLDVFREYNDVETVCKIYIKLLMLADVGEVYNVCSGKVFDLFQILSMFEGLCGHQVCAKLNLGFVRKNEIKVLRGNPEKLEKCIGPIEWKDIKLTLKGLLN
jgi:GDP-6-deoxy-D-talose 4-dehydrogenase